jgi:uncharacterized membrane protein
VEEALKTLLDWTIGGVLAVLILAIGVGLAAWILTVLKVLVGDMLADVWRCRD